MLDRMNITGADLTLSIKVKNPNAFSMMLKSMNVQFIINGNPWAHITQEKILHVVEDGSARLDIPFNLNFLQMGQGVYSILTGNSNLDYELNADVDFSTSHPLIGDERMNFVNSGVLRIIE